MSARANSRRKSATAAELVVERLRLLIARHEGEPAESEELKLVERRLGGKEGAYRTRMAALFALSKAELDALDCAVAVAAEPALGPLVGALQGIPDRHLPTEIGLRLLFGHGPAPIVRGGSPLLAWGLVEGILFSPDEPTFFRADPAVVDWYFGMLSASAIPLRRVKAVEPLAEWQIDENAKRIAAIIAEGRPVRIGIVGRRGTGRASLADCLARKLEKQAICVEGDILSEESRHSLFLRLQRLALLGDLALIWRGAPSSWPASLPVSMLQMVTLEPGSGLAPVDGLVDLTIAMPPLGVETRAKLYRSYLPSLASKMDSALGEPRVGDLADAAAQKIASLEDLRGFLRQRNSARTAQIGRVERADFGWNDLVLDDRTKGRLVAFADEARRRAALLADPKRRRMFGDSAHLSALFSGPPGLGKSMSAKVIASVLGLDLLVVDSAAITSKFIGETAKNLSLAFEIARDAQCALHFEEADNFFTTRVKVETSNDRHSNADIGHLLQLMEMHEGVVILSSNRRVNIDAAFTRRLRVIVDFKKPKSPERQQLWERMLALLGVPTKLRSSLVPSLALAHELTPAQIKGAALTAAYRAVDRPITARDVEEGVRLEFEKEGRLVSPVEETLPVQRRAAHG